MQALISYMAQKSLNLEKAKEKLFGIKVYSCGDIVT